MSKRPYTMLIMASVALLGASNIVGDDFEIDWWSVDGGGQMWTTGNDYELSATIGQPDANSVVMSGGEFELTGGFWPGASQEPPGKVPSLIDAVHKTEPDSVQPVPPP